MRARIPTIAGVLILLLVASCREAVLDSLEPESEMSGAASSFDGAKLEFYAAIVVTPPEGAAVDSVWCRLFLVAAADTDSAAVDTPLVEVGLGDDGLDGDILPLDGMYARKFSSVLPPGFEGDVIFEYRARIAGSSYALEDTLAVVLKVLSEPVAVFDKAAGRFYTGVILNPQATSFVLDSIWVELYMLTGDLADSLGSEYKLAHLMLRDDGFGGDSTANDSMYARSFSSPLSASTVGTAKFLFLAAINNQLFSVADTLVLSNQTPEIISVSVSDTLQLPPAGFIVIDTVRVTVDDADGLFDIRDVSFTSLKPDGTLSNNGDPIYLFDNGNMEFYGDVAKGDGIYSRIIQLGSESATGTYTYRFVTTDYSGAVSDTTRVNVEVLP